MKISPPNFQMAANKNIDEVIVRKIFRNGGVVKITSDYKETGLAIYKMSMYHQDEAML